jgi:hypothetical protein
MKVSTMKHLRNIGRIGAGLLVAILAASSANARVDASIPFANHGGIYDWRPNGDRGIWVQAANKQWYYGTFFGTCFGLDTAPRVGFVPEVTGEFDRWSSIVVPHEPRCHLQTFEPSAAPQGKDGRVVG